MEDLEAQILVQTAEQPTKHQTQLYSFGGRPLMAGMTLMSAGVQPGSTIYQVLMILSLVGLN